MQMVGKPPASTTWGWSVRFPPVVPESVIILSRDQDEDKAGFAATPEAFVLFQLYLGISYFSLSSSSGKSLTFRHFLFLNFINGSLISMSWLL